MSVWAFLIHADKSAQRLKTIREPLCYDGLENFASSQYEPNYINQIVGRDSLFIYDFNFSPLNRKGRMSERQKLRKLEIEGESGKFPRFAIQRATSKLLHRLYLKKDPLVPFVICSDEHFQYRRALRFDLQAHQIEHLTVSSKATRNYQNILFAVNHSDLLIRQRVAAFSRETISFAKTHARMCQKFALFMIHKNYFAPQFTKAQVRRPKAHVQTPAQALGIENRPLKFYEFFDCLRTPEQVELPEEWKLFIENRVPFPREKVGLNKVA